MKNSASRTSTRSGSINIVFYADDTPSTRGMRGFSDSAVKGAALSVLLALGIFGPSFVVARWASEPSRCASRRGLSGASATSTMAFSRSGHTSGTTIDPLGTALKQQPEATLAWLRALPPGVERDQTIELAMGACDNSKQALSLFSTLPPDAAARAATSGVVRMRDQPERCAEWAMALPAGAVRVAALAGLGSLPGNLPDLPSGPDRDALLSGILRRMGPTPPPAKKLATMLEIGDPVLRRDMFEELMESYSA